MDPQEEQGQEQPEPLTPKQDEFCRQYLVDLNGAAAARRAGYSIKSAGDTAYELLKDPRIEARIRENRSRIAELAGLTALGVALELKRIMTADLGAFIEEAPKPRGKKATEAADKAAPRLKLKPLRRVDTRAIQSIRESEGGRLSIKLYDKVAAAENINKMFGWNSPEQIRMNMTTEHEDALSELE